MASDAQPSLDFLLKQYLSRAPHDIQQGWNDYQDQYDRMHSLLARARVELAEMKENFAILSKGHSRAIDEWAMAERDRADTEDMLSHLCYTLYRNLHDGDIESIDWLSPAQKHFLKEIVGVERSLP